LLKGATSDNTPGSTPQKGHVKPADTVNDTAVVGEARDQSPPKKRARQAQHEADSRTSPAVNVQSSASTSANAPVSELETHSSATGPPPETTVTASSKKVARISAEEYVLKQKPKEIKRDSSSIAGKKNGKSKAMAAAEADFEVASASSADADGNVPMEEVSTTAAPASTPSNSFMATAPETTGIANKQATSTGIASNDDRSQTDPTPAIPASSKKATKGSKAKQLSESAAPILSNETVPVASSSISEAEPALASTSGDNLNSTQPSPPQTNDSTVEIASDPSASSTSSSSLPTTPQSTKKGKARSKKAETPKPAKLSMVQEILQRQRERLAAEAAAKTSPGQGSATGVTSGANKSTPSPREDPSNEENPDPAQTSGGDKSGSDIEMDEPAASPAPISPVAVQEDIVMDEEEEVNSQPPSQPEDKEASPAPETSAQVLVPETIQPDPEPVAEIDRIESASIADDSDVIAETVALEAASTESTTTPATAMALGSKKARSSKGGKSKVEVPCNICLRTPWHYQKDCPEVKAGAENLKYLLSARQDQHNSIVEDDGDSHFAQSVEAIQEWIERLEKIAGKVQGVPGVSKIGNAFRPRSPIGVMGAKDGSTYDLKERSFSKQPFMKETSQPKESVEVEVADISNVVSSPESINITLSNGQGESSQSGPSSLPSPAQGTSTTATATAVATPPESPAAVPDTFNFPPIHLKALQKSRRTGSTSGLSVSDAYIETEPSDDSSSDEDEDEDQASGHDENDAEDTKSGSDSESSSAISSDSDDSFESATSRVAMPANPSEAITFSLTRELSEREKKKARLSAAKMQPVSFDEASVIEEDDEEDNEDEDGGSPSLPPPARLPRNRADSDSSIGDYGDDASRRSSMSDTASPIRRQAPPVIASSSVAPKTPNTDSDAEVESVTSENGDEGIDVPMDDSDATPALADPIADDNDDTEDEPSAEADADPIADSMDSSATKSSRSFREIDGIAASSPEMDDAGSKAVQQGIADEEDDTSSVVEDGEAGSEVASLAPPPVPTQSLSQARRTRRQSSQAQSQASQIATEATAPSVPTSSRTRRQSSQAQSQASQTPAEVAAPTPNTIGVRRSSRNSVPPQDVSAPAPVTRLRSVSREVQEKTPPPPSRSTRSTSRSRVSMSPSVAPRSPATPRTRRVSATQQPINGQEDETPKQVMSFPPHPGIPQLTRKTATRQTRQTRSSQVNQLDSSLPIIKESDSSQSQPYSAAIDGQTQSTPVRRSTRASPSPLFMTQGSQIPATQFYNPLPETIPEEASSPPSSAQIPKPRRNAKASIGERGSSPIAEAEETGTESEQEEEGTTTPRAEIPPPPSQLPSTQSIKENGNGDTATDDVESLDADGDIEMNDNDDAESQVSDAEADDEEEEDDIPDIPLPTLRRTPASQPAPSGTQYTGLSSLPLDLLRSAKTYMFSSANKKGDPITPSGPMRNGTRSKAMGVESDDDSGESSDSSAGEVEPPSALKGRFVSGGVKKKAASQPMSW
jgi:serine/arginine repetitive matrix protein 2